MLRRFVGFLAAGALLIGFGYLFYLNPESVELRLTAERSFTLPLPFLLLTSFMVGGTLVFGLALFRETQWTVSDLFARRRQRKLDRRRSRIEKARELQWEGRSEEARDMLRRAERSGEGADAVCALAEADLDSHRIDEARRLLENARPRFPEDPRILELLARTYERLGQRRTATVCLEQALQVAPESPRLLARLRDGYVAEGRWQEAWEAEERRAAHSITAMRDDGTHAMRIGLRYQVTCSLDDDARAIDELRTLVSQAPEFLPAWVSLGDRLRRSGQDREAEKVWLRALRRRLDPILLDRLEALYRETAHPERMVSLYQRLRRDGASQAVGLELVRLLLDLDETDAALEELERTPSPAPEPRRTWLEGEVYRRRGKTELALRSFHRGAEREVHQPRTWECTACQRSLRSWAGRCPHCGAWDHVRAAGPWAF